jgi:eukaryotic-like serine/threonine-protein kinase
MTSVQEPETLPAGAAPTGYRVLDRYVLERRLGSGGFGVVWLAWDERLERQVAVKVVPREDGDDRIGREARAAARLGHPGIVALYELAEDEHDVYLVSELVQGRTLAELERRRALSDRDVARIGGALCEALEHAHDRGVIHRDVKPENVMVVAEPAVGAGFAKLTDFGVAHLASGDGPTRTGDVVGTLAYMAPEQAEGERATPACDVYSLALTLYEAWAGFNPVRAAGPAATARRLGRPLPPLGSKRRDLPPGLCEAVDEALSPWSEERPALADLRAKLRAAEAALSDEGGLVEPETIERLGLTALHDRDPADRGLPLALARVTAGAGVGLLVLVALERLGPEPPLSAPAAAALAAVITALLPRVGWLAAALGVCGWLASPEAGREGTALVLAVALAPVPLLLPRAGHLWSTPALAPLLGATALGPAFAGLAALAWKRGSGLAGALRLAALGATGFLWIAVAEVLTGEALLYGAPDGAGPRSDWQDSLSGAVSHALAPLLEGPALAPVAAFALFAALLPLVVRGRLAALDLVAAGAWAAGLAAALTALGDVLAATTALDHARGAVAGALLGALAYLAAVTALRAEPSPRAEPLEAA